MYIVGIIHWPQLGEESIPTWTADLEWVIIVAIYDTGLKTDIKSESL